MKPPKIGAEDHQRDQLRRIGAMMCARIQPGGCFCIDKGKPLCANILSLAIAVFEIAEEEAPKPPPRRSKKMPS